MYIYICIYIYIWIQSWRIKITVTWDFQQSPSACIYARVHCNVFACASVNLKGRAEEMAKKYAKHIQESEQKIPKRPATYSRT